MNRSVSTILIPLLLVSQSVFSVAHSHAGSAIVEPHGHAVRPHVHLHGAGHVHRDHDESDKAPSPAVEHNSDHDSDAVYAGDDWLLHDGKVARITQAELARAYIAGDDSSAGAAVCRTSSQPASPPLLRPRCAHYLRLQSIRC